MRVRAREKASAAWYSVGDYTPEQSPRSACSSSDISATKIIQVMKCMREYKRERERQRQKEREREREREKLVFVGTFSVTTALVSAFTKM